MAEFFFLSFFSSSEKYSHLVGIEDADELVPGHASPGVPVELPRDVVDVAGLACERMRKKCFKENIRVEGRRLKERKRKKFFSVFCFPPFFLSSASPLPLSHSCSKPKRGAKGPKKTEKTLLPNNKRTVHLPRRPLPAADVDDCGVAQRVDPLSLLRVPSVVAQVDRLPGAAQRQGRVAGRDDRAPEDVERLLVAGDEDADVVGAGDARQARGLVGLSRGGGRGREEEEVDSVEEDGRRAEELDREDRGSVLVV